MRYLFSFALFVFSNQLSAQTTVWEKTSFPDSNYIYFISTVGDKIFAGSSLGLFVSSDEGATWQNLTQLYAISSVNDLIFQDGIYYLSSWVNKVWKSTDLATWESLGEGLPQYVTSVVYFEGNLYASTSNSVYALNPTTMAWEWDSLPVNISHNDYILDLAVYNAALYASGCDYLYTKGGGLWQVIDTSYNFCGVRIRDDGSNIFVNTTGSGIQKYDPMGLGITETIIADAQDPYSWSAAEFIFHEGQMLVASQYALYYHTLDSSEVVCGDLLTSMALNLDNIFVGTHKSGIWKKGWQFLQQEGGDRGTTGTKSNNLQFDLSPTPSEGKIVAMIRMEEEQPAQFTVFDATGKIILDKKVSTSLELEIRLATPGLYMAVLSNGKEKLTKRVIIQ